MARLVLAGKTDYDLRDFSRALCDMLYDLFGVETMDFVIEAEGDPDRDVKAKAQVAFLRHVLQEAQGKAEVDVASVAAVLGVYVNSKVGRSPFCSNPLDETHARPARLRRRALPLRARDVRPRVAHVRQGRLPGGRLRRDGAQVRRALRRVEDVSCAVVEPLLRAVAAPAPALHDRAHDGRRVPARPRAGYVEGHGRRVPQESRRAVRHGGRSTGRGAAARATPGDAPWGVGQRQAVCAEPRDQGRRDVRRDGAVSRLLRKRREEVKAYATNLLEPELEDLLRALVNAADDSGFAELANGYTPKIKELERRGYLEKLDGDLSGNTFAWLSYKGATYFEAKERILLEAEASGERIGQMALSVLESASRGTFSMPEGGADE